MYKKNSNQIIKYFFYGNVFRFKRKKKIIYEYRKIVKNISVVKLTYCYSNNINELFTSQIHLPSNGSTFLYNFIKDFVQNNVHIVMISSKS